MASNIQKLILSKQIGNALTPFLFWDLYPEKIAS